MNKAVDKEHWCRGFSLEAMHGMDSLQRTGRKRIRQLCIVTAEWAIKLICCGRQPYAKKKTRPLCYRATI